MEYPDYHAKQISTFVRLSRIHDMHPSQIGECWIWTRSKNKGGYGSVSVKYSDKIYNTTAHRLAWEWHHRTKIPNGMVIMHTCDNPSCVNPYHLKLGTQADNMADKHAKGRYRNGGRIWTNKEIREMQIAYFQHGITQTELAEVYNISQSQICQLIKRDI